MRRIPQMANLSFSVQNITESGSQLVLTYSNLSVEAKLAVLGILVTLVLAIIGASCTLYKEYQERQRKIKGLFNLTWKNSTSIKADEILGNRPFNEYYYPRGEDRKVRDCLKKERSVLIVAPLLAEKQEWSTKL